MREHLLSGGDFFIGDYFSLAAQSPGVLEMVERLRTNRPASAKKDEGAAFIYREGMDSAMEREESARRLTLALAGRAKNVAPLLAAGLPLPDARLLVDVGGGTGIYSIRAAAGKPAVEGDRMGPTGGFARGGGDGGGVWRDGAIAMRGRAICLSIPCRRERYSRRTWCC